MASLASLTHISSRFMWPLGCLFMLFSSCALASPTHGRRMICWQAIMQCQGEVECNYAYSQYTHACAPVMRGARHRCPSHCISSLIQLNQTKNGPALEDCDCAADELCRSTKRAIEPCLPRTSGVMGCTEARRQCDRDPQCSLAMHNYLIHCGKLFSGIRCTESCRNVIRDMLHMPKAALLDTCVCDGIERPICESVKINMQTLCFGADDNTGSGWTMDSDEELDEGDMEERDVPTVESAGDLLRAKEAWTVMASILLLLPLL
ncbi:growth arrest-specific protein 1a [Amia ocellicauda]|uniref:growth arrest-specific protein 1a n=1 Tax=Amia ocellicauda TaxID=2972642 RepID=UPI0034645E05|nr:GAS1 protein [Amia calva]